MRCRHSALAVLLCLCMVLAIGPVLAQAEEEHVTLIVTKAPHAKKSHAKGKKGEPPDTHAYAAVKKKAGDTTGHAMSLSKAETWSVPKSKVEG
jgi:hypothetical protein